jgi:hypothetical protein
MKSEEIGKTVRKQVAKKRARTKKATKSVVNTGLSVPQTPSELRAFVLEYFDAPVPMQALLTGSDPAMAYLAHAFFEGRFVCQADGTFIDLGLDQRSVPIDCCVWGPRGGGKTFLGAVATALDLIFKPGIEIRILGGSLEQSRRMYEHLQRFFSREDLRELVSKQTEKGLKLHNGSRVEILAASQRAIRGTRVQKLRCDEADLFDQEMWQASQLVTRSLAVSGPWGSSVRGGVEVLSTMHVPMGLMYTIVEQSRSPRFWMDRVHAGEEISLLPQVTQPHRTLFRWSVVDVLEVCAESEVCATCVLQPECQGLAKTRSEGGHLRIADAQQMKARVSDATWQAEMLCKRPRRDDAVLPEFDQEIHVRPSGAEPKSGYITAEMVDPAARRRLAVGEQMLVAGIDFGMRAPCAIVWALVGPQRDQRGSVRTHVHIIDAYVRAGRTMAEHARVLLERSWGLPVWVAADPAGHQRSVLDGQTAISVLKKAGLHVITQRMGIAEGVEVMRRMLKPASGTPSLMVEPRCREVIEGLTRYHYSSKDESSEQPEKDGPDHVVDAVRYMMMGAQRSGEMAKWSNY